MMHNTAKMTEKSPIMQMLPDTMGKLYAKIPNTDLLSSRSYSYVHFIVNNGKPESYFMKDNIGKDNVRDDGQVLTTYTYSTPTQCMIVYEPVIGKKAFLDETSILEYKTGTHQLILDPYTLKISLIIQLRVDNTLLERYPQLVEFLKNLKGTILPSSENQFVVTLTFPVTHVLD